MAHQVEAHAIGPDVLARLVRVVDLVREPGEVSVVFPHLEGATLRTLLFGTAMSSSVIGEPVAIRIMLDLVEQLVARAEEPTLTQELGAALCSIVDPVT